MVKTLEKHVKDFYQQKNPSSQLVDRLVDATRHAPRPKRRPQYRWVAAAAVFLALSVLFVGRGFQDLSDGVAREVVANHRKDLEPEFRADSLKALRDKMTQLPFQLKESSLLSDGGYKVQGGRYCTLQTITAAQIRVVDEKGKRGTLYQVADTSLENIRQGYREVDELGVFLWIEDGVLFALAVEASASF